MTYCVGLCLQDGLVFLSDTRTNAGVDNIATFSKMHVVEAPGERVIVALTAGNLAVTQSVMNAVLESRATDDGPTKTLAQVESMIEAVELVGTAVRTIYKQDGPTLQAQNVGFDISILLGGQIKGRRMRLFQIYSAGNYIEATQDTAFLQIGEHKYGKPILDRVLNYTTDLYDGVKLCFISMDSTLRSNLTVGLPIDLAIYKRDALRLEVRRRIGDDDPYFRHVRQKWSDSLRQAYQALPRPEY
jgi:putative proteasome-type protease